MIVEEPALFAVTTPSTTEITFISLLDHVTRLLVALAGVIVYVNVALFPVFKFRVFWDNVIPCTGIIASVIVTTHWASCPPSSVVTVNMNVPAALAVNVIFLVALSCAIVTISLLLLEIITFLLVALAGCIS